MLLSSFPRSLALAFALLAGASRAAPPDHGPITLGLRNAAGTLEIAVSVDGGRAAYRVDALDGDRSVPLIGTSPLGLTRTDADFDRGLRLVSATDPVEFEDRYTLAAGKCRHVDRRGRERVYTLNNATGMTLTLTVRAYDDGVAFRYGFPGHGSQLVRISGEATGFAVPADARVWMQPYSKVDTWAPGYEADYVDGVAAGTASPSPAGWALPLLFHAADRWALVTESGLGSDYFGLHLQPEAPGGRYLARLPEPDETYGVAPQAAAVTLPWLSPWRVVITGRRAGAIAESTLVTDLAQPADPGDFSWVHPGLAAWSWWADMSSPSDAAKLRASIDAAAVFHWPYCLLDSGWQDLPAGALEDLVAHARERHVGLLLWYNSGGKQNRVPDAGPHDLVNDPLVREAEFARIERLGIKGVKVDFMQSDKQFVIALYHDILRDAARHHLMVDFHGATIPRGWERTHPNLVSMEAVRGSEQYWDATFAEHAQLFNSIYVFTRNAIGPMDYTPTILTDPLDTNPKIQRHLTTNAHELALLVVFQSGIQHVVDPAADLLAQPDFVRDYLTDLPAAWDETRVPAGEPGQLAIVARRSGSTWYLSGINGGTMPRSVRLPLDFLSAGAYRLSLIGDGPAPAQLTHATRELTRDGALELSLAARGGFAARLRLE